MDRTDRVGPPRVDVRRSARRKRTVTAYRQGDTIVVLLPQWMSKADERRTVDRLVDRVLAGEGRRRRPVADADLAERADRLSRFYLLPRLGSVPLPSSVGWVGNQQK